MNYQVAYYELKGKYDKLQSGFEALKKVIESQIDEYEYREEGIVAAISELEDEQNYCVSEKEFLQKLLNDIVLQEEQDGLSERM